MKFKINQLVILARPEKALHMKGTVGCIVRLPGDPPMVANGKIVEIYNMNNYTVHFPGFEIKTTAHFGVQQNICSTL